jgi:hypothetical protein
MCISVVTAVGQFLTFYKERLVPIVENKLEKVQFLL